MEYMEEQKEFSTLEKQFTILPKLSEKYKRQNCLIKNTAGRHKYNKEAAYYTGKVFGYFFRIIPTVVLGATRRRF